MCDNYARMVNEGTRLLRQINPNAPDGRYCPEAADAVHDFLETGEVRPVTITGLSTFPMEYAITGLSTFPMPTAYVLWSSDILVDADYLLKTSRPSRQSSAAMCRRNLAM